uniref:Myb/SANT-like domain-containing protein n=1 Tax=Opuntia streptacantha TaxID=393608 RepID=A0A7C9E263_OPUST
MDCEATEHQTKDRLRTRWTACLDKIFADLVVEQIQLGNRPNNVFDKKAWGHIRDEFNRQTGLSFNNNQLRKHLDVLRTRYNQLKSALIQNDFSMDDSCGIGFDLWDSIGVNPGPGPVKIKDCPIYEQLCIIFADNEADGRYAQSSHYEEMVNAEAQALNPDAPCSLASVDPSLTSTEKGVKNNLANNKRKRSLEVNQSEQSQKDQEILDSMAEALSDMIATSKVKPVAVVSNKEKFSITNCIKALDEIERIGESLYFAALDLFDDPCLRETFISLKSSERYLWLQGKCCNATSFEVSIT